MRFQQDMQRQDQEALARLYQGDRAATSAGCALARARPGWLRTPRLHKEGALCVPIWESAGVCLLFRLFFFGGGVVWRFSGVARSPRQLGQSLHPSQPPAVSRLYDALR